MKTIFAITCFLIALAGHSQDRSSLTIYFDLDKYELTDAAKKQVDSLLAAITGYPGNRFELEGHCDATGTNGYNDVLSVKRARTVRNYLLSKKIPIETILSARGYGEQQLLNDDKTEEERQLNRRVVITVSNTARATTDNTISLEEKITDSATTAGTTITLRNIHFYGGMSQFLPASKPVLDELLRVMQSHSSLVIEIQGHICCQPGPDDGFDRQTGLFNLSHTRAKAIRDFLIENGIDASRVTSQGFGHSKPINPYPEETEEQRTENRRVEIKIVKK